MHQPHGIHCLLELIGCPADSLSDIDRIESAIRHAADIASVTLIKMTTHRFETGGVTAVALLSESHLSIHTWPEHGYAAVDLFTCGRDGDAERACASIAEALDAERYDLQHVFRGNRFESATSPHGA